MMRIHRAFLAALIFAACAKPVSFSEPLAPTLPRSPGAAPTLDVRLAPPDPSQALITEVSGAGSTELTIPRSAAIAIIDPRSAQASMVTSRIRSALGDEGTAGVLDATVMTPTNLETPAPLRMLRQRLTSMLIEAGYRRILLPEQLASIAAELKNGHGDVLARASLGALIQVEPLPHADVHLHVDVRQLDRVNVELPPRLVRDAEAERAYFEATAAWRQKAEAWVDASFEAERKYAKAMREATATYESNRGTYSATEPTAGDRARTGYQRNLSQIQGQRGALERALERLETPADLERRQQAALKSEIVDMALIEIEARVVDGKTLAIRWLGRIRVQRPQAGEAVADAIGELIAILSGEPYQP